MTITVTHAFVSAVADDPSVPQEVRPSNWNANHVVSGSFDIVGWTPSLDTTAPNDTVNASHLQASGGTTDQDAVISPAGLGAFQLAVATGDSTGGNKRGANAIDLQIWPHNGKTSPTAVASGVDAVALGYACTASGISSMAMGQGATAAGNYSIALGGNSSVPAIAINDFDITIGQFIQYISTGLSAINTPGDLFLRANFLTSEVTGLALGFDCHATGGISFCLGGLDSTADGGNAGIINGSASWMRGRTGYVLFGGYGPGPTGPYEEGGKQLGLLSIANATTDATPTVLISDITAGPSAINQLALPPQASFGFHGRVLGRNNVTGDTAYWTFDGAITQGVNAASTALVAAVTPTQICASAGASGWGGIAISADTTNGALSVTVTGEASTSIYWLARIEAEELVVGT